ITDLLVGVVGFGGAFLMPPRLGIPPPFVHIPLWLIVAALVWWSLLAVGLATSLAVGAPEARRRRPAYPPEWPAILPGLFLGPGAFPGPGSLAGSGDRDPWCPRRTVAGARLGCGTLDRRRGWAAHFPGGSLGPRPGATEGASLGYDARAGVPGAGAGLGTVRS